MTSQLVVWSRRFTLFLLATSLLWAGESWQKKPFTEWDFFEVDEILSDSPWAQPLIVGAASARMGLLRGQQGAVDHGLERGVPGGIMVVRWFSAVTLREACVRSNQLAEVILEERAQQLLAWQPEYYVVGVGLLSVGSDPFWAPVEQPLPEPGKVFLELASSKRRIAPVKHQRLGTTEWYFFPREEEGQPLLASEKKVKFSTWLDNQLRSVTFDLRKMTREGKPDL